MATSPRVTITLPTLLADRCRDLVYFTPGLTMTALVREALELYLDRHQSPPVPRRARELTPGRPLRHRPTPPRALAQ